MKFEKVGVIKYPKFINIVSIYIGKLRDLYNVELNERNSKYKRGELSEFVNILGVKGELIIQHFLHSKDVVFRFSDILAQTPQGSADIYIGDTHRIDVKTINDGAPDLLVNEEAHNKGKNITHYWFVRPHTDASGKPLTSADYWIFTYDEVSEWKVKNVKYSNAYYMELKELLK